MTWTILHFLNVYKSKRTVIWQEGRHLSYATEQLTFFSREISICASSFLDVQIRSMLPRVDFKYLAEHHALYKLSA